MIFSLIYRFAIVPGLLLFITHLVVRWVARSFFRGRHMRAFIYRSNMAAGAILVAFLILFLALPAAYRHTAASWFVILSPMMLAAFYIGYFRARRRDRQEGTSPPGSVAS